LIDESYGFLTPTLPTDDLSPIGEAQQRGEGNGERSGPAAPKMREASKSLPPPPRPASHQPGRGGRPAEMT